jgi:hypothetical protein
MTQSQYRYKLDKKCIGVSIKYKVNIIFKQPMSASLIAIMCESGKSQLYRQQMASLTTPILKVSLGGCIPRSYQQSDAAILCLYLSQ